MSVKQLSTVIIAIAFGACTFASQANNEAGHNWVPNQPTSNYWQAPNWPGFNAPPSYNSAPPHAYNNNYQRPPPPAYRPPPANYPGPYGYRAAPPPPPGPYNSAPAPYSNQYRGAPPRGAYDGPSAFYTPGYNPYGYNRRGNNGWNNNKFWGRSSPNTWMNPSKRNWENSWDDMINTPSRMGEMPGGWTAPEVTMPNPIDMGDQMQDNVKDLPEQIRNMNVGNDVNN